MVERVIYKITLKLNQPPPKIIPNENMFSNFIYAQIIPSLHIKLQTHHKTPILSVGTYPKLHMRTITSKRTIMMLGIWFSVLKKSDTRALKYIRFGANVTPKNNSSCCLY